MMNDTEKQMVGYHWPLCVKCICELHPEKNNVGVLDKRNDIPSLLWNADMWKCPSCGIEIAGNFGLNPVAGLLDLKFNYIIANYRAKNLLVENKG
jgi:hypothetical protein